MHDLDHRETARYLFAVAYRMLGSAADAEDVVQEAMLRHGRLQDVRSTRAMLTTIVTRLCIDELRSARRRRTTYVGPWLPEPVDVDSSFADGPERALERAESSTLGFLLLMESLTPLERAVFVLREVVELDSGVIAEALGKSEPACRKILERARAKVAARRQRPLLGESADEATARFLSLLAGGDVEGLTALLVRDATCVTDHGGKARASRRTLVGASTLAMLFLGLARKAAAQGDATAPARLNGSPAIVVSDAAGIHTAIVFEWAELEGQPRLRTVYVVRNPDKLAALRRGASPSDQADRVSPAREGSPGRPRARAST